MMISKKFLPTLVLLLARVCLSAEPAKFSVDCFGEEKARLNLIFLHGIESRYQRLTADDDRIALSDFAKKVGARIAAPKSSIFCQNSTENYCWGAGEPNSIAVTYAMILRSAAECWSDKKNFILIGFSNGGYHVARVLMRGLLPQPIWGIAIASGGDVAHSVTSDLSRNGKLTLLVGDSDPVLEDAKTFVEKLRGKKLDVEFRTFPGGHEIPYKLLEQLLTSRIPEMS